MSFMSWLFPNKKRSGSAPASSTTNSAFSPGKGRKEKSAGSIKRKGERTARRELLYTVVREAMTRAGVLSASYKFKVLSLDGSGHQYLIMVDLGRDSAQEGRQLAEIEALIAQSAKARHDMLVTAVYWRMNDHVAIGSAGVRLSKSGHPNSIPHDSEPAALESAPAPLAAASRGPAFEAIAEDEVAAFRKALKEGSTLPVPLAATPDDRPARPHNYTLLTGFEDTEMPEPDKKAQLLSGTQYGELR